MSDGKKKILNALNAGLLKQSVQEVIFAEADVAPPLYAFVVNFPSLVLVLKGRYEIERSSQDKTIKQCIKNGQVLYVRPNCWYRPTWKYPSQVLTILFGPKQTGFSMVTSKSGPDNQPVFETMKFNTTTPLSNLSRDLIQLCEQAAQPFHDASIGVHLVQALMLSSRELLRTDRPPSISKSQQLFEGVCAYVQEHFHQPLTRESIARLFDVTPNHISRVFQTKGLMKFWDYVTLVRIDRAKLLLRQYDIPIKQIAVRCGFAETSYFCRIFKRRTKLSPNQYRLKYKSSK